MQIYRSSTQPTTQAPEQGFVGNVQIGGYHRRPAPSRLSGAIAQFAPGARTPWKVNSAGQTIVVTSGTGWAQCEGEEVAEIRAGDLVWFKPGVRHWEGATPVGPMTYAAFQEESVEFLEMVGDDAYLQGPPSRSEQ